MSWTNNGRSVYRNLTDPTFLLADESQAEALVRVLSGPPLCPNCNDELECFGCSNEDVDAAEKKCAHPISEVGYSAVMNGTVTMTTFFKCHACGERVEPGRGYDAVQMGPLPDYDPADVAFNARDLLALSPEEHLAAIDALMNNPGVQDVFKELADR